MKKAHYSTYAMHPGSMKMYRNIKGNYWWKGIKGDIVEFVSKCLTSYQIKAEHKHPAGYCNPYQSQNGNGNTLQWILL